MVIEILSSDKMLERDEKAECDNAEKLKRLEMEMRLRGFSNQTCKTYKFYNGKFLDYIKKDPTNVTEDDIKEYIAHKMVDDSISNTSITIIRAALLFYYKDVLNKNINFKPPKKDKKLPVILTKDEVIKLIKVAENPKHKLIIELLYSTGMRLSEAINLKYSDINFKSCVGYIRKGKGSKDRIFLIGVELQNNLIKYHEKHGGEYVLSVKGKQMSPRTIQHIIKNCSIKAGIDKNVHPHTLRHSFATHLYEDGVDVLKIQALLNNTIWDLYWQIMLLVSNDKNAFIKEGIPDLFKFFKNNEDDPTRLNDLLNETSVRRTRDYIKNNYPDAEVNGKKIKFPERKLSKITYNLDSSYKGMYKEIADIISVQIKMPFHRMLKYRLIRTKEEDEDLNRMIALVGIFRIILLKRLESSVDAFRVSINKQVMFLDKFKEYMMEGKLLSKKAFNKFFNKYIMITDDEIDDNMEDLEKELKDQLVEFDINNYNKTELFGDIEIDLKLLKIILEKVEKIKPYEDAKLIKLKDMIFDLQKNQLVLFTYFTDTLDYIYKNIISSKEFYNMTIAKISGKDSRIHKSGEELEFSREKLVEKFFNNEIDILLSTDVLSEGQNLQSAQIVINYDLHWNPTRMIQRAGRIDRIGPHTTRYVYSISFQRTSLRNFLN